MATRKSFAVIVLFKGFGNGAISFAYASRILAGNQPRTHSGSRSSLHFASPPNNIASCMSEPLDIRHLRYFLAVAEAGSFSRAADRLGISQPSVSQQMRDLEAGLRVPLFQRRGKRILLTPRGLIFQEHARALLRQLENLLHELNGEPGELRGALHLGVIPVLNVPLVPQLLGAFVADHPAISVTVEEISSTEIETALEEGRMDVGLGFLTRHSPNLSYERLCTDEFALILAQNHPWANRRVVNFPKLHQQRLLQLPDSFVMRRMSDEICRKHQVRPHVIAEINAIETLLRSLGPLQAAALMPKIALRGRENLNLRAIRLRGKNLGLDIGLLRLSDSAANTAVAAFTSLAKATVPKLVRR
jgi:LysR family transcriptional regulator, cyn operon transcriptional activator